MKYRVYTARAAKRDLRDAADYIEFSLKNRSAAERLLDVARSELSLLADSPERFQLVDDPVLSGWGIRYVIIHNYLAFYVIDPVRQMVIVVRFLYQGSNWKVILQQGFAVV